MRSKMTDSSLTKAMFRSRWLFSMTFAASATLRLEAFQVPAVMICAYSASTASATSGVDPLVILRMGVLGLGYPTVFLWTLLPGLVAVGCLVFLVKERVRTAVPHVSFREGLRQLPPRYRRFLVAVGIFGAGSAAVGLYVAHNVFYAGFAFVAGWLADRVNKARLLAAGYALAAVMAVGVIVLPLGLWTLAAVFVVGGIYVAIEETLEDALCAELVPAELHGMAFGVLATVNGVGDFLSSVIVGALWSACGVATAFGYSAVLFAVGSFLVLRVPKELS